MEKGHWVGGKGGWETRAHPGGKKGQGKGMKCRSGKGVVKGGKGKGGKKGGGEGRYERGIGKGGRGGPRTRTPPPPNDLFAPLPDTLAKKRRRQHARAREKREGKGTTRRNSTPPGLNTRMKMARGGGGSEGQKLSDRAWAMAQLRKM